MEGISGKRQHVGTRRTIARSSIVKGVSLTSPIGTDKNRVDSKKIIVPHRCMPPPQSILRCRHCNFSSISNRERQYHIIVLHSKRYYHTCPLCPRKFRSSGDFNFHLCRAHEYDPSIAHHFQS